MTESSQWERDNKNTLPNSIPHPKHTDTPMKDYLPTPVTPVTPASPHFNNEKDKHTNINNNNNYSAFSVIKPETKETPPTDAKPYSCPECHQTFSRPHNLKSHLTTHSSERPFQCDVCKHHFRRHHDLKRHQKLHTGERPYVCNNCFRSFARLDALNRHRRAEGGTACSAVHHQQKQHQQQHQHPQQQVSGGPDATYGGGGLSSPTRPVIPQLHIPHPASRPYPSSSNVSTPLPQNNANRPTSIPNNHNNTHSSPSPPTLQQHQQQQPLLPSPSALSDLPVSEHNNLTPIIYNKKHLPLTPNSPPHKFHPYQWSPYPRFDRPTLPPLSSPPISNVAPPHQPTTPSTSSNSDQHALDRLRQENDELKRDINQLRAMAQKESSQLKSRLHDLEVENKVLRSLIQKSDIEKTKD